MNQKAESTILIPILIAIVGTILVALWAIAEALNLIPLSVFARWGLGLFVILIEVIQSLIHRYTTSLQLVVKNCRVV